MKMVLYRPSTEELAAVSGNIDRNMQRNRDTVPVTSSMVSKLSTETPNERSARISWRAVTALAFFLLVACLAVPAIADDPDNCLMCHQYRGLGRIDDTTDRLHLYFVDPDYGHSSKGPHARLACTDCHEKSEVSVVPHEAPTPVNCTRTCHLSNPNGLERIFSHETAAATLEQSAHARTVLEGITFADGPLLDPGQSQCLYCHDEPLFRDPAGAIPIVAHTDQRVFDRCDTCHRDTVRIDIDYYVKHVASRLQPARSTLGIAQVCAVCHSDSQVLRDTEMSDAVASYMRSFHGKAALLGDSSTANCLSCHVAGGENAHLMLGQSQPLSSVHASHVADSCRSVNCHPGADLRLAQTAVHLDIPTAEGTLEFGLAALFIIITVLTFGPSALLVVLDLFQVVIGREEAIDPRTHRLAQKILEHPQGRHRLIRFSVRQRIEHWILAAFFIVLVATGFPLKFPDQDWASTVVEFCGGPAWTRAIHHWAGLALLVGFVVHLAEMFVTFRRSWRETHARNSHEGRFVAARKAWTSLPMWITKDDVRKTLQLLAYFVFLRKHRPTFGRFSPTEKFEYLGVFWGTALLGITGLILWAMHYSSYLLTGRAFNLATIAHTYEAFLAVIHVGILHIYNVILAPRVFPLSQATLTGHTPFEKLTEEHGEMIEEVARELNINESTG